MSAAVTNVSDSMLVLYISTSVKELVEHNHDLTAIKHAWVRTVLAHAKMVCNHINIIYTTVLAKFFLGFKLSVGSAVFSEHVSSLRECLGMRLADICTRHIHTC